MLGRMSHPLEMNLPLSLSNLKCLKLDELVLVAFVWLIMGRLPRAACVCTGVLAVTDLDLSFCSVIGLVICSTFFRKVWEPIEGVLLPENEE